MHKLIVVTGGTKGIGRAILEKFAANGFDVATCARNQDDLTQLKKDFESKFKVKVFEYMADMSDKTQVKQFTAAINKLNRSVDVLVNNAGYFEPGQIMDEPDGTLEGMVEANVYSAFYTTRGLVQKMKESKSGHIFNMCSIASFMAYPNGGSYAISKFALLGFSKVLRAELMEFGIRVTAVMPGATKTASWAASDLPDNRFMKPEDVAEAVFSAHSLSPRSVVEEILIRPQMGDI